jgi:hypothetical protein
MPPVATRPPSLFRIRPHSVTPACVLRSMLLAIVGVTVGASAFAPSAPAQTGRGEAAAPEPPDNGDTVTVTGQVTDSEGRPVAGVHVVFEAHRSYFSLRRFEHRVKDFRRVETVTDETGRYRLEWLWDDYFNRFLVGVETPGRHSAVGAATNRTAQGAEGSGDDARASPYLVEQTDLRSRLVRSGSAVVPLVIEDTERLEAVRRFESSLATEDQRRVYRDLGYPDEVQVLELAAGREASWWYFERGEVYRFADGDLQEIEPFEPVTGF